MVARAATGFTAPVAPTGWWGGDGDDLLRAGPQDDALDGGAGSDTCNGGANTDTRRPLRGTDRDSVTFGRLALWASVHVSRGSARPWALFGATHVARRVVMGTTACRAVAVAIKRERDV